MKRQPGKGVLQRWVIQHRGKHYFRDGNIAPDARLSFEWVLDRGLATEFTEWHRVVAAIDDATRQGFKCRPMYTGKDPQGIQRNLDRCLLAPAAREWAESALTARTLQSPYLRQAMAGIVGVIIGDHPAQYVTGDVQRLEALHRKLSAKDVPTGAILDTIFKIQGAGSTWATLNDLQASSPALVNLPRKVVAAKCARLEAKGLLTGHSGAEFRNEYELTDKGRQQHSMEHQHEDHVHLSVVQPGDEGAEMLIEPKVPPQRNPTQEAAYRHLTDRLREDDKALRSIDLEDERNPAFALERGDFKKALEDAIQHFDDEAEKKVDARDDRRGKDTSMAGAATEARIDGEAYGLRAARDHLRRVLEQLENPPVPVPESTPYEHVPHPRIVNPSPFVLIPEERSEGKEPAEDERTDDAQEPAGWRGTTGEVQDGVHLFVGFEHVGSCSVRVVDVERGEFEVLERTLLNSHADMEGAEVFDTDPSFDVSPGVGITKALYLYPPMAPGIGTHDLSGPRLHGDMGWQFTNPPFPKVEPWMLSPVANAKAALQIWRERVARGERPDLDWYGVPNPLGPMVPWPWMVNTPNRARAVLFYMDLLEYALGWERVKLAVDHPDPDLQPDSFEVATEAYISRDVKGFATRFLEVAERGMKD